MMSPADGSGVASMVRLTQAPRIVAERSVLELC